MISAIPVQSSVNWAIKPSVSCSIQCDFVVSVPGESEKPTQEDSHARGKMCGFRQGTPYLRVALFCETVKTKEIVLRSFLYFQYGRSRCEYYIHCKSSSWSLRKELFSDRLETNSREGQCRLVFCRSLVSSSSCSREARCVFSAYIRGEIFH